MLRPTKTCNRECDGSVMIFCCYHFRSTAAALFSIFTQPTPQGNIPNSKQIIFYTLCSVFWVPPYWNTLVYIRIAMILPRRNITCSDGDSQNSVGEVEKTRLRLPGTSVMSLSSPAHLRLLIAALAILMLPWSPPLTAFEGCASTQDFGRQTSNLHPKANKSKLFKGEVPKTLKIPALQRRGWGVLTILDRQILPTASLLS